ncbi:phosphoenolpyruvate-protein phosphotransferase [Treponema primitia ZAS-2]|uniref:Phosphoenolpyruvate-protein phosphotransferase n=1 Tax=Treponema primitia (strain ATCC BAA-887 / DSM 12427 / ZAS-2) TaxID=545694 RepID=F5YLP2_TREPZ|nr:phosphoenolpyruvate--protein phosphotransferase [Treponema primitia]AEF83747.1 phosphoenolpyruvate-protein phosphotransferase [Treponema primitia ZAS-2]
MKKLSGVSVSPGIVIGKSFLYQGNDFSEIPRYAIGKTQVEAEWRRLQAAIEAAVADVRALHDKASREMSKEKAAIFETHLLMLEDPEFQDQIKGKLETDRENIEWVVWDVSREISSKLMDSGDAYLRERAVDIADVSRRLMHKLLGIKEFSLADLAEDVILVAHDLLPSEVLTMNKDRVKGIVTDLGGRTSHTAILARAFGTPAVLGLSTVTKEINAGDTLIVDGSAGQVIINPGKPALTRYQDAIKQYHKSRDKFLSTVDLPAETKDGHRVSLKANIEIPEEAAQVIRYGAEGIGLYRSEFLFLTPGQAAEEERQYQAYSEVLKAMGELPVTIRTLDVGGDKVSPNFKSSDDKNPLLGWRAIRMCLALPDFFKIQLRAILRASVYGNVKIMFPMISGVEELEQALALLKEAKAELRQKKQKFSKKIEVGTMIEIPSAAMTADVLAWKSDFFSIGTNDLLQYTLAVDRGNEKVSYLAQPFHPAVLRLLKMTIDAAHDRGIKAAMCGELAGATFAVPILLGLGLDEFSMTASAIPLVKQIVRGTTMESCRALAEKALASSSYKQTETLVNSWLAEHFPNK